MLFIDSNDINARNNFGKNHGVLKNDMTSFMIPLLLGKLETMNISHVIVQNDWSKNYNKSFSFETDMYFYKVLLEPPQYLLENPNIKILSFKIQ